MENPHQQEAKQVMAGLQAELGKLTMRAVAAEARVASLSAEVAAMKGAAAQPNIEGGR